MCKKYFYDLRLYYYLLVFFMLLFENIINVCDLYIGIYGIYEIKMREFDFNVNDGVKDLDFLIVFCFLYFCVIMRFDYCVFFE